MKYIFIDIKICTMYILRNFSFFFFLLKIEITYWSFMYSKLCLFYIPRICLNNTFTAVKKKNAIFFKKLIKFKNQTQTKLLVGIYLKWLNFFIKIVFFFLFEFYYWLQCNIDVNIYIEYRVVQPGSYKLIILLRSRINNFAWHV